MVRIAQEHVQTGGSVSLLVSVLPGVAFQCGSTLVVIECAPCPQCSPQREDIIPQN